MTILQNPDALIGDFLGTIPVMQYLAQQDELQVMISDEAEQLFDMMSKPKSMKRLEGGLMQKSDTKFLQLDISKAFQISHEQNLFMSQAHFAFLGLPVPEVPPKAILQVPSKRLPRFDYVIAPFSRSLPDRDKWPAHQWQRLVEMMPDKLFCVIGHGRDPRGFISGSNVCEMYNEPLVYVLNLLKRVKHGLISVVSGPSHMAFHLGVKNILLTNQRMTWGNNPEATAITTNIPDLAAEEVMKVLNYEQIQFQQ